MKKKLIIIGALIAVIALAVIGGRWLHELSQDRADGEATAAVQTLMQLLGDGNPSADQIAAIRSLLVKMQDISTRCREDARQYLLSRRMDGAFIIGDYATAEKLMDEYTARSEAWRTGAKAKIRAHAAIVRGDNHKAVAELETFIQMMLKEPSGDVDVDPTSNEVWSREMVIAKNYFRMALLAGKFDPKLASTYTAKAQDFIDKARKTAEGDTEMLATIDRIVKDSKKL